MRTTKEPTLDERAVGDALRRLRQAQGLTTTTVVAYRLSKVTEERGRWLPCVGPTVEFPHTDRRKTAYGKE